MNMLPKLIRSKALIKKKLLSDFYQVYFSILINLSINTNEYVLFISSRRL